MTPLRLSSSRIDLADRVATVTTWSCAGLVSLVFTLLMGHVLHAGLGAISWEFLTAPVQDAGRGGGILSLLVSTLGIVGIGMLTSLVFGLGAAIFLSEHTRTHLRLARLVRLALDILAGIPSIVFGLFGNAVFCKLFGFGFSILSGGLTLACMILPILIRSTEEGLRSVPLDHRLAGAALGLSRASVLRRIVLPAAAPGLIVGLILGLGRAMAETAALIFTSGYVDRMPGSVLDSGRALSVHIYDLTMNVPGGNTNAFGSALVLLAALLTLTTMASWLTQRALSSQVARVASRWQP